MRNFLGIGLGATLGGKGFCTNFLESRPFNFGGVPRIWSTLELQVSIFLSFASIFFSPDFIYFVSSSSIFMITGLVPDSFSFDLPETGSTLWTTSWDGSGSILRGGWFWFRSWVIATCCACNISKITRKLIPPSSPACVLYAIDRTSLRMLSSRSVGKFALMSRCEIMSVGSTAGTLSRSTRGMSFPGATLSFLAWWRYHCQHVGMLIGSSTFLSWNQRHFKEQV